MDRGIFDIDTIERINMLFDDDKRYDIPYFTEEEVKGFIEKYKEYLHPSKKNKTVEENAHEIFEDTQGHPIMIRFSVLQDGLKTHVNRMYADHLVKKDDDNYFPNTERIKSVIACSLYDISSIPLTDDELFNKLNLKKPSLQLINTMIKRNGNIWTTIHPRWDLELFKYMFSLNEADRIEIQDAFSSLLTKIVDIYSDSRKQLDILNTLYNTIAAKQFVDIKIIQEMIKIDDIEKKLDQFFKGEFFIIIGFAYDTLLDHNYATICFDKAIECFDKVIEINPQDAKAYSGKGISLHGLGRYEEAIDCFDKVMQMDPQYAKAYNNKGAILSELGRNEEAIASYDKALEIDPQNAMAYNNKGAILSELGRNEEAIESYDDVLVIDPNNSDALNGKAFALAKLGKNEEALPLIQKLLESHSNNEYYISTAAFIMYNLGKYDESKIYYNKALEINPNLKDTLSESELKAYNAVM